MPGQIGKEHRQAVSHFMVKVVVPLLYELPDGRVDQIGICTLFRERQHRLLITARHNLEGSHILDRFTVLKNPIRSDLDTLGSFELFKPNDPPGRDIDVAVLRFLDQSTIGQMEAGWHFLTTANTGTAPAQGIFVLSGYPSARAKISGQAIGGSLNTIYTKRITAAPPSAKPPVDADIDLFFHYDKEGIDLEGRAVKTPALPGVSGSSVWEYREISGLWPPENALKVVGIQTSWIEGDFARAKIWAYVQHIIQQLP